MWCRLGAMLGAEPVMLGGTRRPPMTLGGTLWETGERLKPAALVLREGGRGTPAALGARVISLGA